MARNLRVTDHPTQHSMRAPAPGHHRNVQGGPARAAVFGISDFHTNETSFAMAFGGGIDIKLNHRFDVRAGQIDWNIITRGDQQTGLVLAPTPHQAQTVGQPFVIPGMTQNNLRLSVGIIIH